jgi:hypothetical protein
MRSDCEVPGIILLQAYMYTYRLLRGITFEVLPLNSYALKPKDTAAVRNIYETPVVE